MIKSTRVDLVHDTRVPPLTLGACGMQAQVTGCSLSAGRLRRLWAPMAAQWKNLLYLAQQVTLQLYMDVHCCVTAPHPVLGSMHDARLKIKPVRQALCTQSRWGGTRRAPAPTMPRATSASTSWCAAQLQRSTTAGTFLPEV